MNVAHTRSFVTATSLLQPAGSFHSSLEPRLQRPDSAPMPRHPNNSTIPSSWVANSQVVGVTDGIKGLFTVFLLYFMNMCGDFAAFG